MFLRTEEMAQRLRVFAALVEDLDWVPRTHMTVHNFCDSDFPFWPPQVPDTHTHALSLTTLAHKIGINKQ